MKILKKELKIIFENYALHSMCLLIEVFKGFKLIELAKKQEEIKEEFLEKLEGKK